MSQKVAIVTGSNKGIGYAIVKGLCEKYSGKVYLTSRDEDRGHAAVASLQTLGLNPSYFQLDINDISSINRLREYIQNRYGTIDILINNAAIAFKMNDTNPFSVQAKVTVDTNYFGTLKVSETLIPLLGHGARLINVSSSAGHLSRIPSEELRRKFSDPCLTIPELNKLMDEFITAANQDSYTPTIWGNSAYVVSKVGVSALTRIQQKMLDDERPSRNIYVNSVHPGYVDTDMTGHKGTLTIEEGAAAPLYLALEPHGLKGQYVWRDGSVVDWLSSTVPVR
ncbi:hypothetical protein Trydic_g16178 [Trypoxylus dichotomus]